MADYLYQTVLDRNNPDEVEQHGPYKCTRDDAWLGHGYYFWHHFIGLAHWWGRTACNGSYMICKQTASIMGNPEVLDLHSDVSMIEVIGQYAKKMQDTYRQKMTVRAVLEHMKKIKALETHKAVRISAINSTSKDQTLTGMRLHFKSGKYEKPYFDMCPPIQICVYDKSILNKDFHIIFPDEYNSDYVA